tara:strand:- start:149 stop:592 length:444 start_codon:yes stop_codon:yes gene_type:complete
MTYVSSLGFLLLRLSIGIVLIHHGYEKLENIENFADAFVRPLHLPFPVFLSYGAAASEILGSWLLIAGLGTRLGALAITGTITIAIYHAISTSGFNIYLLELLVLYWGGSFFLLTNGGGMFSIDELIKRSFGNTFTILRENFNHMGS